MLDQPLEPIEHTGETGGRVDGDEFVVPGVDVCLQQSLTVERGVERQQQADVDDVRPPAAVGIGQLAHRGEVEARVQQQLSWTPPPAAGELLNHTVVGDFARHLLQLGIGYDEVKHMDTNLNSTKGYFKLGQKRVGSSMLDERIVITLVALVVALIFRSAVGLIFKRKLRELVGYQLLANALTGALAIGLVFYLLYVWGIVRALVEMVATLGVIAIVLLFTIKDIWLSNLFAGFSLIGDKLINIGSEVEVAGKRGKIVEMTLTVTKIKTAGGDLIIVPNKKFREDVVVIVKKRG